MTFRHFLFYVFFKLIEKSSIPINTSCLVNCYTYSVETLYGNNVINLNIRNVETSSLIIRNLKPMRPKIPKDLSWQSLTILKLVHFNNKRIYLCWLLYLQESKWKVTLLSISLYQIFKNIFIYFAWCTSIIFIIRVLILW